MSKDDVGDDTKILKKSKSVRFEKSVRVVLIPTRQELHHLHSTLFYSARECHHFCQDSVEELLGFMETPSFELLRLMHHMGRNYRGRVGEYMRSASIQQRKHMATQSVPKDVNAALKEAFNLLHLS
jgi:hypothetical protein